MFNPTQAREIAEAKIVSLRNALATIDWPADLPERGTDQERLRLAEWWLGQAGSEFAIEEPMDCYLSAYNLARHAYALGLNPMIWVARKAAYAAAAAEAAAAEADAANA